MGASSKRVYPLLRPLQSADQASSGEPPGANSSSSCSTAGVIQEPSLGLWKQSWGGCLGLQPAASASCSPHLLPNLLDFPVTHSILMRLAHASVIHCWIRYSIRRKARFSYSPRDDQSLLGASQSFPGMQGLRRAALSTWLGGGDGFLGHRKTPFTCCLNPGGAGLLAALR